MRKIKAFVLILLGVLLITGKTKIVSYVANTGITIEVHAFRVQRSSNQAIFVKTPSIIKQSKLY